MPQFNDTPEPGKNGNGRHQPPISRELEIIRTKHEKALEKAGKKSSLPPKIFEPRCHACTSEYRRWIEKMLLKGHSYLSIEEGLQGEDRVDRRSISTHHKKHMTIDEQAYRAILEEEASIEGQDYETGIRGAITMRGILEIAARKGFEDILNDNVVVEPKDLIQIAKLKAELDANHAAVQVDEMRRQVTIFTQAIQNIVPPDMQATLVKEIRKLRKREEDPVEYERAIAPPIIEASASEIDEHS